MANTSLQSLHQQCVVVDALIVDAANINVPQQFIPGLHAIARSQLPAAPKKSIVIGSSLEEPHKKVWESLGCSAHFGDDYPAGSVLALLQQAIFDARAQPNLDPSKHLFVLVTVDGVQNDHHGLPTVQNGVLTALRLGFNVKLICFVANPVYLGFAASFPNQMQIMIIDKAMVANASAVGNVAAASVQQPPRCALVAAGGAAAVNVQQPLQQAGVQSLVTKAYDFLHNRNATSAATAVLMSQLGDQLKDDVQRENVKLKRCLLDNPTRFCLLNLDKPGRESVYILPPHT